MKKFKTWIIHLLGGVTKNEAIQSKFNCVCLGSYKALTIIKEYADSLNGKPADEWCELVYTQICRQLESVTQHGTDEEIPTGKEGFR